MIRSMEGLLNAATEEGPARVSVAAADDRETLAAVIEASRRKITDPILVGNREWIDHYCRIFGKTTEAFEVIHEKDAAKAAALASEVVLEGRADILMKGNIVTSTFLHAALGSAKGLKKGLLSDVEVFEDTRKDAPRLVLVSDGGVNISPGIRQKLEIIRNAVEVAHRLGMERPKVALLSGSEKVHPDFQSTIDSVALVKMCQDGAVEGCVVDGPFALDNAIDTASAKQKGIESPVAGNADILIVPTLEAGNIFCKGLQYYGGKMLIHVAMGALAPILIDSRTASSEEKLHSLALAVLLSKTR
jgi:phosphate butyryltransferase